MVCKNLLLTKHGKVFPPYVIPICRFAKKMMPTNSWNLQITLIAGLRCPPCHLMKQFVKNSLQTKFEIKLITTINDWIIQRLHIQCLSWAGQAENRVSEGVSFLKAYGNAKNSWYFFKGFIKRKLALLLQKWTSDVCLLLFYWHGTNDSFLHFGWSPWNVIRTCPSCPTTYFYTAPMSFWNSKRGFWSAKLFPGAFRLPWVIV